MDNNQAFGLEFLDLSGVDDGERRRVLASLCSNKKEANLPWFIGDENTGTQDKLKPFIKQPEYTDTSVTNQNAYPPPIDKQMLTTQSQYNLHLTNHSIAGQSASVPILPVVTTTAVPVNNQYYAPQFISPVATIAVQNYSNIPATAVYTTYPTYPVKTPVYYGVPPTQQIFVTQTNTLTTPNMQQQYYAPSSTYDENAYQHTNGNASEEFTDEYNNSDNNYATENNYTFESEYPEQETDQVPVDTIQYNVNVQDDGEFVSNGPVASENNIKEESYVEAKPEVAAPLAQIPVVNSVPAPEEKPNDTVSQTSPWGANKSWASLFSSNEPKQVAVVSPTLNGTIPPPTSEAVKKSDGDQTCPFKNPKKDGFVDPDCYRMGEFLSNYVIDGRTFSLQPRGLINQSNYCYINSILQALMACPPMYNLLIGLAQNITSNEKRKKTPVIDGICKFVKEFKHLPANMRTRRSDPKNQKKDQGTIINTDIPFEPAWIYKMLNGIRTEIIEGRQEDAEEFLCCLLNNLNDEMLELIKLVKDSFDQPSELNHAAAEEDEDWQVMGPKNKGSVSRKTVFERSPITDIFSGSLKSKIIRAGDNVTENTQPFLTLQLNIEKVSSVKEALEALTTKYQLEGLTSSKTNEQVDAWQQVMLDKLPMILVLHLKCFDFRLEGCTKIVKALEFPIDLKIDSKLLSSQKVADPKQKQYKLFAVVYHDGKEATKGHYVTDAFHVGYNSWLRYDDASVKTVQEEHVLKPQGTRVPYLLFYRRSDTIRSR